MLLMIAAVVATIVVINSFLPTIQRTGSDIVAASDVVGNRLRTDVRIIETAGVDGAYSLDLWAKNVGAARIPTIDKLDLFFGETNGFGRITYDDTTDCSDAGRSQDCWQYVLENDTKWEPFATLRITVYLTYSLSSGTDYVSTIVLPNGITASKVFSL
jgi:hypothetical protein